MRRRSEEYRNRLHLRVGRRRHGTDQTKRRESSERERGGGFGLVLRREGKGREGGNLKCRRKTNTNSGAFPTPVVNLLIIDGVIKTKIGRYKKKRKKRLRSSFAFWSS